MTLARRFKPTKRVCRGLYEVKQEERKEREVLEETAEEKIVLFWRFFFCRSLFAAVRRHTAKMLDRIFY